MNRKVTLTLAGIACILTLTVLWWHTHPAKPTAEARPPVAEVPAASLSTGSSTPSMDAPAHPDWHSDAPACSGGTCNHPEHAQHVAIQAPRKLDLPLDFPTRIALGNKVAFELPDGRKITCEEPRIERDEMGVVMVQGTFTEPAKGSFFFRRQDFEGVAGKIVGHVTFDGEETAWKVLPEGPNGDPVLKEVSIHEVVCVNYSPVPDDPQEMPQDHPSSVAQPEYQEVIPLQSLPGAPGVIYLDFDGSKGPHDTWSYKGDASPSGLSNSTIRDIWIRVAEDFMPFNINVTTDAKVYENATRGRRIRCIVTPTNWYKAGGVAYIGSYNWGGDPVCWANNYTGDSAVTVISHEVGHTLGLYHHGYNGAEYYGGHGSGATSWAPIMGTGYGRTLKHWSDGSYYLATRKNQKDLTTITNQNGVDFRPDDGGDALANARYLWIGPVNTVTNQQGLIETPGDIDSFRFKTTGGAVNLTASTATTGINLDIKADIVNAATGAVVFTSDSTSAANATISTTLSAGEYLLRITGATVGTPATSQGGYSNYGCLGSYKIDGTVAGGETHQALTIAENSTNGTIIGTITPRTVSGNPLSYTIASGNTGNILALNPSTGALTVANSTALNFETLSSQYDHPAIFELFVTITNTSTSASETVRSIITVTDVNEPPVLAAIPSDIAVFEGTTPGVQVADLSATDPDRFDGPVYEIVSGNSAGYFAINSRTGSLTVVNVPQVTTNTPVTLVLRARDQKTPTQYSVNRTLTITITDLPSGGPGTPGTIVRTFFRNISGTAVTDLTGNANFPNKPDEEVYLTSFDGGSSAGDNYGSTIRGYLIPPVSGEYRFWIAADNGGQLILGSNATQVSTPVIASVGTSGQYAWDQQTAQASTPVTLTAGQPHYIEARQKEATSGDHVAVAWSGPGIERQVIPGLYLVPLYQNYAPTPTGTFTIMETAPVGTVVGTVSVADVNKQDSFENFTITAGNTGNVFAINATTGQITVASAGAMNANNTPFYQLTVRTTDDGTPALNGSGTVRININASQLYFDPNGTAAGSVANAGSYGWRTSSWATGPGGTAAVGNWIPNAQAIFSATKPPGTLAYDVDLASYNTATHGGFGAIRALGGTVRFTGNVDNFYLIGNTAVEAAPGAAIEFNQTRTSNALLAFNLNSQTVTFDGNVTFNNGGMGNTGNVIVNNGKLALNAANPYTGSTTVNNGTLALLGSGAIYTTLAGANHTVTLNPGTTLELDRWVGTNRSLGQLGYAAQNLVIDGATVRNAGLTNPLVTDDSPGFTIGTNGATLESATAGQMWRILTDNRSSTYGIVSNGSPLTLTGAGDGSITKVISGTDTALLKTGPGTWYLGAINTYGGGTTVSEGTLQFNNTGSLPGAATVESNSSDETKFGTLFMNLGNTTWNQDVGGAGRLKVATGSGSHTTVMSGNYNAFNGTLEVATGNGKIQLGTATKYPASGSTIHLNANTTLYLSGGGTLQSDIRMFGGTIGEPTYGQLRIGAANAILNGDITLHANTTIAADSSRTATISGVIGESGGSFGFTKNQPGVLILTETNTHTGGTTVNAGTLQTGTTSGKLGPGNLTVASGAICQIRNTTGTLGRQAYVFLNGTGKLDLASGVTERVSRLYIGGVLQAAGTFTAANLSSNISGAGSLIVNEVVPNAPTSVTATLASWNALRLNWSNIAVNHTSVRVERSLSPTNGFVEIANLNPSTSTYLDPGLAVLTPYHYRVRVSNIVGFSAYSEVVSVTTRAADPPADLTAVAGNAQVALSWSASDGATGYVVKRGTDSGGPYTTVGTTAATSFSDTTAANGTTYHYIVLATALGAESDPSDEVSARPLPPTGTGVWAADSGGNWSDVDNWQNFVIADGASNTATFGRPAGGTVTADSAGRTLGTLNFAAGDYLLSGFPVALDNGATTPLIDVASNRIATIEPLLNSTNGLRKTGGGRLQLASGSSYTGSTSVDGGVLALGNAYAGSAYLIVSGATLELDTTRNDFSLPATNFTGTGTLRKSGQNRAFWGTTAATFALGSGSLIEVTGGTLVGGSNANEVWTNNKSDLSIASGATFDGVEANVRVDGISGSGTIRTGYSGAGYLHLAIGVDNGSSTFDGVIADRSAAGNLRKEGTGTITLAGNNTFTGTTTIATGILHVTSGSSLGAASAKVTFGGNNTSALSIANGFSTSRALTLASGTNTEFRVVAGGTATWRGTISYSDASAQIRVANAAGGTLNLQSSASNAAGTANPIVLATGNLVLDTGFSLSGSSGNLLLGRGAASELTAKGTSNTSLGPIQLATSTATPSATLTIQDSAAVTGTTLDLNNNGATTSASTLNLNGGTLTIGSVAKTRTGGSQTATFNLNGGELKPSASNASFWNNLAGTTARVKIGGARIHSNTFDITIAQALLNDTTLGSTPDGGLTKNGTGILTLSANNTYTGPTTVNGGTLIANTAAKMGTSHLTVNTGATCDLRNTAGAIADTANVHLNGSGRLILANGVAETVARLYVNNALQAAGTYTAASHPALVSGGGSLVVTTSLPLAPTSLAATAISHQTIDLTWADNEVGESGYLVERSATTSSGFTQIAALPANSTSYSDTGLAAGSTRFYRVRAAASSGNSTYSNEASATTLPSPPAAPGGLTATAGGFAVRLDWTTVPAATAYRIRRSTSSGSGFTQVGTTATTHFIDGNLAAGVPVFYQVSAEISGSVGADSSEVSATPLAFVQWDGGDLLTNGAQGGSGPWNTTTRWWNGFTNATWPATGLVSEAVFAATAGTVTLDPAGLIANRLSFNTTGYLLENGHLTLNGSSPSIFTSAGVTTAISSAISGSAGLTKTGTGSLVLGGSNTYGATFIQQGHLQVNHGGSLGSGSLNLGTGAAGALGTVGNLSLNTNASAGAIQVVSNTSDTGTASNIGQLLIASGRTLTATSLSAGLASSSAGNTRTALATGLAGSGGTLTVNGSVVIGSSGSVGNTLTSVDLSGLGNFNLNAPTGHLRIGHGALTKGTLILATQSTINTATISVGETIGSGNSNQFSTLHLGSGTNTLQTNDLRIGIEKTAGVVQFAGPAGSVTITGTHGSGKAAIAVGRATGGSYQGVGTNSLLLAGHHATVNASTVVIGRKGAGTSGGNITATLSFDTGTFSADEIRLADVVAGSANTTATGTFTLGTDPTATGILTVNGAFILATNTNSTSAQTATGSLVINGGTANILGAIKDASTTNLGTSNTTLTLDGGTLDLNGHPIGGDGTAGNLAIDTLHFRRGTLRNVSQINHGSTGLTKTTSGLLTLSGTHTYTGPTTIAAGKLVLDASVTSDLTANSGTLAAQGTPSTTGALNITATGRFEIRPGDTLTVGGSITLAGNLDLIAPPGIAPGSSYTILNKTSPGPISGTFAGLPEGSNFNTSGYNWQITYTGGDGNDTVITIPNLSAIESWRQLHFGTPANSGNGSDSADSNNDGETNLLEFTTAQNPHATTRATVSLLPAPDSKLNFTYTRSKAAFDAGYLFTVEHSDTLAPDSWTSAGGGTVISDGTSQIVRALIPAGPAGQRFVRLRVSAP